MDVATGLVDSGMGPELAGSVVDSGLEPKPAGVIVDSGLGSEPAGVGVETDGRRENGLVIEAGRFAVVTVEPFGVDNGLEDNGLAVDITVPDFGLLLEGT